MNPPDPGRREDAARVYEPAETTRPATAALDEDALHPSPERDAYAAFRFRDYRLYIIGSSINGIGTQMADVAVGWELYERTRDPLALGLVGLVLALPVLLLSLPAGHFADRFNRKGIVMVAQGGAAAGCLLLATLSHLQAPLPWIYLCLLLLGITHALSSPAAGAMLPQLVPPEVFPNAVTWDSSRWQVSAMVGPALGGVGIAVLGRASWIYVVTAVCSIIFMLLLGAIRGKQQQSAGEPASLQTLAAGMRFVWRTKLILATITMDMFGVLLGGAVTLLPVFAREILHVGPAGLGWLRAAPSIGALGMSVTLAHLPPLRRAGKALLWAVAGFGAATVVFGLSRWFWLSMAMLVLTGALDNISVVVRHTLVQLLTPEQMRGRVSAVNGVFIGVSNELGGFESGVAARLIGTVPAVVAGGVGTVLVVLAVAKLWPEVKRLGSLHDLTPELI